jgi:hypothetical protein
MPWVVNWEQGHCSGWIGSSRTKMTLDEFRESLTATEPPAGLTHALAGLWWDAKGDWKRAHESAQQDEGIEGSWVHAYLHRKGGDHGNAAYWYRRAGKPVCREPLDAEWLGIVKALLDGTATCMRGGS